MNKFINNIGIIGMGYWGPNLYRNFSNNKSFSIKYICDINKNNLNKLNLDLPVQLKLIITKKFLRIKISISCYKYTCSVSL